VLSIHHMFSQHDVPRATKSSVRVEHFIQDYLYPATSSLQGVTMTLVMGRFDERRKEKRSC
jgi:hypothetical protein